MTTKKSKNQPNVREREDEIYSDEYINVLNICPTALTLSTEPGGKGRVINFSKFGETKRISYTDLVRVMDTHPTFLEKGFFYILDERVIRKHGLTEVYKSILDKDKLDKILDMGLDALSIYKQANETQREFINGTLIRRIRDEVYVDLNLVSKIEKISGVKLMEIARDAREMMQVENVE